ncbi:MAG: mannose-6-phosphate isomerase, class I [Propionibacteriaceae bacterium]|nr:mannose-6-phosphate isomerase, class I [Propionibacteriaceae bacterium]
MQPLTGVVKHYDWGSLDAIPSILRQSEDGTPWAEYWLGTHQAGAAVLANDGTTLDTWLGQHQQAIGANEQTAFGQHLPYLLKLLAAEQPLSLQAHPTRADAQAGFAAEQARGMPIDDPQRNFKDDWPKPELIIALTPFDALSGFRAPAATLRLFEALGVSDEIMRPTLGPLRYRDGAAALAEVFLDCLTLDDTRLSILNHVLAAAVKHASDTGPVGQFARLVITLDEHHPGDPSLLAALLLNHVELAPGQALHNSAGVLHSYLRGTGIEVMASSDNVLRAGLTSKHVDHGVLATIVDFVPAAPAIINAVADGPIAWYYPSGDPEFAIWRLEPSPAAGVVPLPGDGRARIVLVTDGHLLLQQDDVRLELLQGESAFIGADEAPSVRGDATAFMAAPGL